MRTTLIVPLALGIAFCSVNAQSQEAGGVVGGSGGVVMSTSSSAPRMAQVIGEPYSARTETEIVQTLADGTHLTRKMMTLKTYRDSQGRTREEHYVQMGAGGGNQDVLSIILISDPVAGTRFSLNPNDHTARVPVLLRPPVPQQNPNPSAQPPAAKSATEPPKGEDLGTQTIEGLLVEGTRITQIIPTGAMGNDQPMKTIREVWVSRELHLDVLTKISGPLTGEQTIRMTDISRNEPDPTLFQIPADYTMVQQR